MIYVSRHIIITEREIAITAVRAQGTGGQNVNKVSSAVHLRFNIAHSSVPNEMKERLYQLNDQRITKDGVIIIKAQEFRNQEQNRNEALRRLKALLQSVAVTPKKRVATKPTRSSEIKRVESKVRRGVVKSLRGRVVE